MQNPLLRILVLGPEESGKSTLAGHLIYRCGDLKPETMKKLQKQKEEEGKSFRQLLQTLREVEEWGGTPGRRHYRSPKYEVCIAEPPSWAGLFGSCSPPGRGKADCLLFVISAAKADFESQGDQTQKQMLLACKLPTKHLVVCVNKMDSSLPAPYDCNRYGEIVGKVREWLWMCSRGLKAVLFLPISGLHGDNLQEPSLKMPWFCHWEMPRENGGMVTGTTLQQLLEALPSGHLGTEPLPAPVGWTKKEEKALLRTWKSLSLQVADCTLIPSTMSTALRQARVWGSEEQPGSKVDSLLRCDMLQGGTGRFPFYRELHDVLGYKVSTAAVQLQQHKWGLRPTANASTAPDLGWAEDVFVLLGPSGQGALAIPKEEKEEELVTLGPSGQEEPLAPEEPKLVEPVSPGEEEEAELIRSGDFGQEESVVPEQGEETELVHLEHFDQDELVSEEGEEAEFVNPEHFGQGEAVFPEEGEEAVLGHPGHFGQGEPVVPEEEEDGELGPPGHFGQGEPVVPEEEGELGPPGHFGQGEPVVPEEDGELGHPGHFGQGEPVVPEEVAQHLVDSGLDPSSKSTPVPRDLNTSEFPESLQCPTPLKSPRCHPYPGPLRRSNSGSQLCPSPSRVIRFKLSPRLARRSRPDPPDSGPPTHSSGSDLCPETLSNARPDPRPGPLIRSSGSDLCPETLSNARPDPRPGPLIHSSGSDLCPKTLSNARLDPPDPGPLSHGSGLELYPGSSGRLETRLPGSPTLPSSPAAGSRTGVLPVDQEHVQMEEDTSSPVAPTQPPSAVASWKNLIGPPLILGPIPGLLPSPPPFPQPLPPAQVQQGPPLPLPDSMYPLPLLYQSPWSPLPAGVSAPTSFPFPDPLAQQAQLSPPYSPPFQQPPAPSLPFVPQPCLPPSSFPAPPRPEGHFIFPPATQAVPYQPPATPPPVQALPAAFSRTGPFQLYAFRTGVQSAYPVGISVSLRPASWRLMYRPRKPHPQPPRLESLLPQSLPAPGPHLPPCPPTLVGPSPDSEETQSSAVSLAPKPTSEPGRPSLLPPQGLPQTPCQHSPLSTAPLPPLGSLRAPSRVGARRKRPPPLRLHAAPSLPSGSPSQLSPGAASQPGSPGSPASRHPPDVPPRRLKAPPPPPPPLLPVLPPLSPFPLPSVPGAPDSLGNRPPPLGPPQYPPSGAPSLVPMSPTGRSPLSPPKLWGPFSNPPSSLL